VRKSERRSIGSLCSAHSEARCVVRTCGCARSSPRTDAEPLFLLSHPPEGDAAIWTYLRNGPFEDLASFRSMLTSAASSEDPCYFVLAALPGERPLGMASYLLITPEFGVIEIGHIWFAQSLRRTIAATEAIYLLARHAFDDLGYRRLEWKCDSLNVASRSAAERFGFTFEGIFRNHMIVKGHNRDTAWYPTTIGRRSAAAFRRGSHQAISITTVGRDVLHGIFRSPHVSVGTATTTTRASGCAA